MKIHELKAIPSLYKDIESGKNNFELKIDTKDYKVGDTIFFKEFNSKKHGFTGEMITKTISRIEKVNVLEPSWIVITLE